ncbi:unnamed protein product [Polarella glacialis]|uniref:Uncharacterized protein n=1 Tax=Polarella glacialis TaxID=89957 RepID=A0A813L8M6_POLGL|nr:unnamed protein product [Polarella glacialis]
MNPKTHLVDITTVSCKWRMATGKSRIAGGRKLVANMISNKKKNNNNDNNHNKKNNNHNNKNNNSSSSNNNNDNNNNSNHNNTNHKQINPSAKHLWNPSLF